MKTKLCGAALLLLLLTACQPAKKENPSHAGKPALMWFDATANFERFSHRDSIDFYLEKIKSLGFTHAVVDIRPITGEVLYESAYAPRMEEWHGARRGDFDLLERFIEKGHQLGLEVHASLNVFSAGHNYFDRGQVYSSHPGWASMVYVPERGIISIMDVKEKYASMTNPIHPEYRAHILNVLKEVVARYPGLDGLMLDRVRYDGIGADFSDLSKQAFEEWLGEKTDRFPEDIFEWQKNSQGRYEVARGKHFLSWIEWRTRNITDFMRLAREEVKAVNPDISFGTYTGAWYPSYYEVGVNFASRDYDPSAEFDWATPAYKEHGYAELIDLYTTGNYYTDVTIEQYRTNNRSVWNETDSQAQSGIWYCVEGSCQNLRTILKDNPFIGGILVDQFYDNPARLSETIEMNLRESDGLMVFDIVHIIHKNLWKEVEEGMRRAGALPVAR
ncbi:MAG: family 10 glycosylhydrolase [Bacteroides sp.]|nr:family 10 glycosylhydrolase [Bacteroides sp.]